MSGLLGIRRAPRRRERRAGAALRLSRRRAGRPRSARSSGRASRESATWRDELEAVRSARAAVRALPEREPPARLLADGHRRGRAPPATTARPPVTPISTNAPRSRSRWRAGAPDPGASRCWVAAAAGVAAAADRGVRHPGAHAGAARRHRGCHAARREQLRRRRPDQRPRDRCTAARAAVITVSRRVEAPRRGRDRGRRAGGLGPGRRGVGNEPGRAADRARCAKPSAHKTSPASSRSRGARRRASTSERPSMCARSTVRSRSCPAVRSCSTRATRPSSGTSWVGRARSTSRHRRAVRAPIRSGRCRCARACGGSGARPRSSSRHATTAHPRCASGSTTRRASRSAVRCSSRDGTVRAFLLLHGDRGRRRVDERRRRA